MNSTVARELHALAMAAGGLLTPEAVVEAAKDATSPLHEHFEWDDAAAAAKHRLDQARALIRSVRIDMRVEHLRVAGIAFVHDPDAGDRQGYVAITKVRNDQEKAQAVLDAELERAAAAVERARLIGASLGLGEQVELKLRAALRINGVNSAVA